MSRLGPRVWFEGNGADIVQMDSKAEGNRKKTTTEENIRQYEIRKHTRHEGCTSTGVEKIQVVERLSQLAIPGVTEVSCTRV